MLTWNQHSSKLSMKSMQLVEPVYFIYTKEKNSPHNGP